MPTLTLDSTCKIGESSSLENPIQGSVSISSDESNVSIARYEGGEIAGIKGEPELSLKWQTFGSTAGATTGSGSVELHQKGSGGAFAKVLKITGIIKTYTGWSSDWGLITDHEVIGKISAT